MLAVASWMYSNNLSAQSLKLLWVDVNGASCRPTSLAPLIYYSKQ